MSSEQLRTNMEKTQQAVHRWGIKNRVTFEPSKEHFMIIHPLDAEGTPTKLLGILIDAKLTMDDAIEHVLKTNRPKITALLRTRGRDNISEMLNQYKTHIWGHAEYPNGCILHASATSLSRLDSMQRRFLQGLCIDEEPAFLDYNFAPPSVRREIGILGLIHKRVLGCAHPAYESLLPFCGPDRYQYSGIFAARHDKQLQSGIDRCTFRHNVMFRSIFGMAELYNKLPQRIVDCQSVSAFQNELTRIVRARCADECEDWKSTFNTDRFAQRVNLMQ